MKWRVAVTFDSTVRRYLADVVGLPVHTQGRTREEAVANAKLAISAHLRAMESLAGRRRGRLVTVEA